MKPCLLLLLAAFVPGCADPVVGTCAALPENAAALKHSFQACDSTTVCVAVVLADVVGENTCVGAFQCADAFPADADLDAFAAAAEPFTAKADTCATCSLASCSSPDDMTALCNETTGLCELQR
jgi:hypothetical protein